MKRPEVIDTAERLYRERFSRRPAAEPWASQWDRVEAFHAAALAHGQLYRAYRLAERRYQIELDARAAAAAAASRPRRP